MEPDFKGFCNELLDFYWAAYCSDIDGGDLQELALKYHLIKLVPATEEFKEEWGQDENMMFVRNFKETE